MKTNDEIQCLFSIKLENGIVITGENPQEVQQFLLDMHFACHDSMCWSMQESVDDSMSAWIEAMSDSEHMFHDAWFTVYKHTKHSED